MGKRSALETGENMALAVSPEARDWAVKRKHFPLNAAPHREAESQQLRYPVPQLPETKAVMDDNTKKGDCFVKNRKRLRWLNSFVVLHPSLKKFYPIENSGQVGYKSANLLTTIDIITI